MKDQVREHKGKWSNAWLLSYFNTSYKNILKYSGFLILRYRETHYLIFIIKIYRRSISTDYARGLSYQKFIFSNVWNKNYRKDKFLTSCVISGFKILKVIDFISYCYKQFLCAHTQCSYDNRLRYNERKKIWWIFDGDHFAFIEDATDAVPSSGIVP